MISLRQKNLLYKCKKMEKIITEQNGKIEIYTFKEGLLSAVAHDLLIELGKFEIKMTDQTIHGKFWLESLKVKGAVVQGQLNPSLLKAKDHLDIQNNIFQKILETKKYPIAYLSFDQAQNTSTFLELKGQKHPLSLQIQLDHSDQRCFKGEVEIKPTIWGIQPYQALFGAIKLQDRIRVQWDFTK